MLAQNSTGRVFTQYPVEYNQLSIDRLFQLYEEAGFLYPAKKQLLLPYFDSIYKNWCRLNAQGDGLLTIISSHHSSRTEMASIAVIKGTNNSLMPQHLVSTGNPFLSLKVMLAAQRRALIDPTLASITSSQNWFRESNRYAFKVFASMHKKLGPELSSLLRFQYLHLHLDDISNYSGKKFRTTDVISIDRALIHFITSVCGRVFVKGEELDQPDIQLKKLNEKYLKCNLKCHRHVIKITDQINGQVLGCLIANRAPIGLNFSLLENRCYFLLSNDLTPSKRHQVTKLMCSLARPIYEDFEIGAIPIVTDKLTSQVLIAMRARKIREYLQSIWVREGFAQWYEHIYSFLLKIESRLKRPAA